MELRTQYLDPCYLASSQVNTPDPNRCCFYGEDLLVHWKAPFAHGRALKLHLYLCFGNWEREEVHLDLLRCVGWWRYRLLGEDYCCRRGIVAYKAQIEADGELLEELVHPLWAEQVGH